MVKTVDRIVKLTQRELVENIFGTPVMPLKNCVNCINVIIATKEGKCSKKKPLHSKK